MADPNPYVLTIDVEFDRPIPEASRAAAAELLAHDVRSALRGSDPDDAVGWGWGRARIEGVYPRKHDGVNV